MSLLRNIRFYILLFAVGFACLIYFPTVAALGYEAAVPELVRYYALWAVFFLYVTLLVGPLTFAFKKIPQRTRLVKATRALGVSSFLFASLHAYLAFFGSMGGWAGLPFLQGKTLWTILLGLLALTILLLLACTSFDFAVKRMGFKKWKLLHRFVYLSGVSILLHAFLMQSRLFGSGALAWTFDVALAFLSILYVIRIRAYLLRPKRIIPPAMPAASPVPSTPASATTPIAGTKDDLS